MNPINSVLIDQPDLRAIIQSHLRSAFLHFRKVSAGKSLTRKERRGMFCVLLRTQLSEYKSKIAQDRSYFGHFGRDKSSRTRISQKQCIPGAFGLSRNIELDIIKSLTSVDFWFDAGIIAENRFNPPSEILRSIMAKVLDELAQDEEVSAESSLDALNNLLLSMQVCVSDAQKLNADLDKESQQTATTLKTL